MGSAAVASQCFHYKLSVFDCCFRVTMVSLSLCSYVFRLTPVISTEKTWCDNINSDCMKTEKWNIRLCANDAAVCRWQFRLQYLWASHLAKHRHWRGLKQGDLRLRLNFKLQAQSSCLCIFNLPWPDQWVFKTFTLHLLPTSAALKTKQNKV